MFDQTFYRWRSRHVSVSLLTALVVGMAVAQADNEAAGYTQSYVLQPGDVVNITVYQEPDLTREALIRPDGGISFPLVGDLHVAGLTPLEVTSALETRLNEFVPESSVTVAVLQINGNQIFVLGKVNRPGAYPLFRPLDVMQALSLAGGAAQFANLDDIRIIRRDAQGRQHVFEFEYSKVVDGRELEQNRLLLSGDTIVVP
jgi:polysaccharide biosynthesis/export protein